MVEVGRERHPEIEFVEGDAESCRSTTTTFDAVTISFGLRNVNRPKQALAEMYRVLKPGGRLVDLRVLHPARAACSASRYRAYLKYVHAARRPRHEQQLAGLLVPAE